MGRIIIGIFVIGLCWLVLFIAYKILSALFRLLGELLESSSASRDKNISEPETESSGQEKGGGRTQVNASSRARTPIPSVVGKDYPPFELSVECAGLKGSRPHLEIKIRGGEPDPRDGTVAYVVSATRIGSKSSYVGDSCSTNEMPAPFSKRYVLRAPKTDNGRWTVLANPLIDEFLPPRGGVFMYDFKCETHRRSGPCETFLHSATGRLQKAECSVSLDLPAPGYVDEIESFHVRQQSVRLMAALVSRCVINVDKKRSALLAWLESVNLRSRHDNRREAFRAGLRQILSDSNRDTVVDLGVLYEVRDTRDEELMESMARLLLELAGKEPGDSEVRKAYSIMRDIFNVHLGDKHVTQLWPEPPLLVDRPAAPSPPSLELKLEPVEEAGCSKGVEVHVRGYAGPALSAGLEFWLWDETSGDTPFLKSAADIDHVHQRAIHKVSWKSGEYNPMIWQSAGVIKFSEDFPPAGGLRRISVGGRFFGYMSVPVNEASVRSAASVINVASKGYESIRDARQRLRLRAFLLAVGLALLSGKGPTYRQDKALKGFAKLLCAEISDKKWAQACMGSMEALIDAHVEDNVYGLTRQLLALKDEACPLLKSQLLNAIKEVMASRSVRSKESREFLDRCLNVLA